MRLDARKIKARIDLVEFLASHGIDLKPVGSGAEYRGVCPFHEEEEPSFQVNRRKGLWHCFGCGAGGDVISFVMKQHGTGFQEALAILGGPIAKERSHILWVAADYWSESLVDADSAQGYLDKRCIGSPGIIERYRIGFALGGTRTIDHLLDKGFTIEEIESSGLVNRRRLDSFFGRVTFPLIEKDKIVNIYGRALSDSYCHMYLPGRRDVIFNIEHVQSSHVVLTESIIDALSLVAIGVEDAVSSLSNHLTRRQVETLTARFAHVDIAFDGDEAGVEGASAIAAELHERGVETRIVALPEGSDINSLVVEGMLRPAFEHFVNTSP